MKKMKRKFKKRDIQALKRAMYMKIIVICSFSITIGIILAKTTVDIVGESGIILAIVFMLITLMFLIIIIKTTPLEGENPEPKREKNQSWIENFLHDEDELR